jgi:hypothetical protein
MRKVSDLWRQLVPYSHAIVTKVDSYRGGQLLASDIPITAGVISYDDSTPIRRRLKLTVPARDGGIRWDPGNDPLAPLAANGQRLRIATGLGYINGLPETVDLGETLITKWTRDEANGTIEIEATDLAQFVFDSGFVFPGTPSDAYGFAFYFSAEFESLIQGVGSPQGLYPTVIDPGLANRGILKSTVVYDGDRTKALETVMAAWPARWYVGDDGKAHAAAPYGPVDPAGAVTLTLTDGAAGTVISRARTAQRGAIFNFVMVRGKAMHAGGKQPWKFAYITDPDSPIYPLGPYGRVLRTFESDLIDNTIDAGAVADAQLIQYSSVGRSEKLACIPDASIELGDIARAFTLDGDTWVGRVGTIDLPLTASDGPMMIGLTNQPGVNP